MSSTSDPTIVRNLVAGGRTLRVAVRHGTGPGPPLLLVNGIGASLELIQPYVDAVSPRREVIRFDVPGVGGSPPPVVPYTFGTLSQAVADLLNQLGHRGEVDVMGFSWGGALAQHFAVQYRKRCRRLVLAATGMGSLMVPAHPRVLARMMTPRRHRDPEYARSIAGEIYGGSMRTHPEAAPHLLHGSTRAGPKRGYYFQLAAGAGWSSLPFLPLIRQRTLVIAGDDDPIIPVANPRIMARLIPHSELHIYRGGHLALLTDAAVLAPVVDDFLDRP